MSRGKNALRLDGPVARRLHATCRGDGEELVVFSHGLGTCQAVWNGLLKTMPARYSALCFDLPGVSPRSQDEFDAATCRSLAPYADDLLSLLDELELEPCILVGHSISGMIGALAAIEAPDRFRQLVTINASPRYIDEPGYTGGFTAEGLAEHYQAMATDFQAWVAGFARTVIPPSAPQALATFSGSLMGMRPDIAIAVARVIFGVDLRSLIGSIAVPTLLIHSRHDNAVPEFVGHYLNEHIAGSQLVWIDADGHLPHLSAPQDVADQLWSNLA